MGLGVSGHGIRGTVWAIDNDRWYLMAPKRGQHMFRGVSHPMDCVDAYGITWTTIGSPRTHPQNNSMLYMQLDILRVYPRLGGG